MPRRKRIHIDGMPLHIVQRGHNRSACFFDDQDRFAYLGWLREALEREDCQLLHAYVLMTNHVHLLLTPEHAEREAQVVISVGRRYVQGRNGVGLDISSLFIVSDPILLRPYGFLANRCRKKRLQQMRDCLNQPAEEPVESDTGSSDGECKNEVMSCPKCHRGSLVIHCAIAPKRLEGGWKPATDYCPTDKPSPDHDRPTTVWGTVRPDDRA